MRQAVVAQLLQLNRAFYEEMAAPFAGSRQKPWPGFTTLSRWLPAECPDLLDVGCGDGRLGRFLQQSGRIQTYTGVDFSQSLLQIAQAHTAGTFWQRDLSQPGSLDGLPLFAGIACLATMQHIPGRANRLRLLQEMAAHLKPAGRLVLANWQFPQSARQRRKISRWADIGLTEADVEPNDYLLTWQRNGFARRYVCLIDAAESAALAAAAGLTVLHQFYSDGREGNLNLYTALGQANGA